MAIILKFDNNQFHHIDKRNSELQLRVPCRNLIEKMTPNRLAYITSLTQSVTRYMFKLVYKKCIH